MQISTPTPTSAPTPTSNNTPLQADYLVIGAGATAMAFVDTLLSESADATVLMVDRQHPSLSAWLATCRLNGPAVLAKGVTPDDAPRVALLQQLGAKGGLAAAKLQVLLAAV